MFEMQEYGRVPIAKVRERIIEQLQLNFAHDNIDDRELETRLEQANSATSKRQLISLVEDLAVFEEGLDNTDVTSVAGVKINHNQVQEAATLVAILGGSDRKGVWRLARYTNAITFMGGMELDFTQAEMPPGVTELNVFCLMGGLDVKVPPGLSVEVHGIPILGGIDNRARGGGPVGGPILRIKGLVIMGGIDVKVKE